MITITREQVQGILSKEISPAAVCAGGDIVVFETRECYDDGIVSEDRPMGDKTDPIENPATGPLYVQGAEPGDILKVEILDIRLKAAGVMQTVPGAGVFGGDFAACSARIFPIEGDRAVFDAHLKLPLDPMIGVIGTAPAGEGVTTDTPDSHGGNMDCRKIVKGSVLYLPVFVKGALLSIGDLHGLMGDGEVLICGLEMAGEVTVRVQVLKGVCLPTPFLYSRGSVMTIQSADTLDEAGDLAAKAMKAFVMQAAGRTDEEAGMLLSLMGQMAVCQVVDPKKTIRMELPLSVLEAWGYRLP